jgi:uncharacterized membrane protein
MKDQSTRRSSILDQTRGVAVLLMIVFHLFYDLTYFGYTNIDFKADIFWWSLPRLIVFLFLFTVGNSLCLSHLPQIKWSNFSKRWFKIAIFALLISLVTYYVFPSRWIYFGTLHSIAFCSLASLPFLKRPNLSLAIALILFIPSIFFDYNLPWWNLPHQSMDYIAPFPWFGASLLGIFAFAKNYHLLELPNNKATLALTFLGQKAFIIYILHQPALFGLVFLYNHLTS